MISDRLRTCWDAGSALALFPILKDWPVSELDALLADIEAINESRGKAVDKAYCELFSKPEYLFSAKASRSLDKARDEAYMDLLATCSEIASVAIYYKARRGVEPAATSMTASENTENDSAASPELLPTQLPKEKEKP